MTEPTAHGSDFTILVVCTGNICRSPLAAQLLQARMSGSSQPVRVLSAGTFAEPGDAMDATAADLSRRHGGDPTGHAAVRLTEQLVAESDLILTASRQHRAAVLSLLPRASRVTFTLAEFARLAETFDADLSDLDQIVDAIASERGFGVPPEDPADDDIADPYRREREVHEAVAAQLDSIVATIARTLGAPDRPVER